MIKSSHPGVETRNVSLFININISEGKSIFFAPHPPFVKIRADLAICD